MEPPESRRDVLRAICALSLGFAGVKVADFASNKALERTYDSVAGFVDGEFAVGDSLRTMLSSNVPPNIYAGEGNIIGRRDAERLSVSYYLNESVRYVASAVASSYRLERKMALSNSDEHYIYDPYTPNIAIGSPVANRLSGRILGYDLSVNGIPVWNSKVNNCRWHFEFGSSEFGTFDNESIEYNRYSHSRSEFVRRPGFRIADKKTDHVIKGESAKDKLCREWMLITLMTEQTGVRSLIICGMHGTSNFAFCRDIEESLFSLEKIVGGGSGSQVLVPCDLLYDQNLMGDILIRSKLDWDNAQYNLV